MDWYSRTELLIGKDGVDKLNNSKVAIFGIGGVGSYTAEALCRAGVGNLVLIDYDDICLTNLNRQIHATRKTVGKSKVDMMKERLLEINPKINVITFKEEYSEKNAEMLLTSDLDYVVDAIDMVTAKLDLIIRSQQMNIPVISCMGAGNKFDTTKIEITDIHKTSMCPLARVIRQELKKKGIKKLKVVFSTEQPVTPIETEKNCKNNCVCSNKDLAKCNHRRQIPGSISFVPSAFGLTLASAVVRDLLGLK
ncbi:MAG: UBA/THIF-type binding protein [Clostridia bacterium]|jgi:tRNA A37 threonylcarbamoyladenosine dehydratase|nr:UBA/THIF-type binding protein [Clostridia bacterium]